MKSKSKNFTCDYYGSYFDDEKKPGKGFATIMIDQHIQESFEKEKEKFLKIIRLKLKDFSQKNAKKVNESLDEFMLFMEEVVKMNDLKKPKFKKIKLEKDENKTDEEKIKNEI